MGKRVDIEAVSTVRLGPTQTAMVAVCDGVEITAGQHSLVRQFHVGSD